MFLRKTFEITSPKLIDDFVEMGLYDRPNRIFVVLSYKVFVRWASVSHAEMSQPQKCRFGKLFHGEWLAWREEKPC